MTWIVGLTGMLTCGALAGDVRVTSNAGHSFDGVQKVHLVTPSSAVGFAGSVRFGLRTVEDMKGYAHAQGVNDFRGALEGWARRVRHAWDRDTDVTKTAALHLVVVTAWPQPNAPDAETPLGIRPAAAEAYVLRSPDFEIETAPQGRAVAIGSGQGYARLTDQLASIEAELQGLANFELQPGFGPIGGPAAPLRIVLAEAIAEVDPKDVSEHLHMCLVKPDASTIVTFDTGGLTPGAPTRTMPEVATNESEWDKIATRHHVADAVA